MMGATGIVSDDQKANTAMDIEGLSGSVSWASPAPPSRRHQGRLLSSTTAVYGEDTDWSHSFNGVAALEDAAGPS
jgi:hypothetical protein